MKFKKLAVLVLVLAVIIAASLIKKTSMEKGRPENTSRTSLRTEPLLGSGFSAGSVTKIDIYRGSDSGERLIFSRIN